MRLDDMLRQAKGTLDNITELAARLTAAENTFQLAAESLDDECLRLCKLLRVEVIKGAPLSDLVDIIEVRERRRREIEAAIRHVVETLTEPRFPEVAANEARIELLRLLPHLATPASHDRKNSSEKTPQKDS